MGYLQSFALFIQLMKKRSILKAWCNFYLTGYKYSVVQILRPAFKFHRNSKILGIEKRTKDVSQKKLTLGH